jgi:hypothetical protein
MNLSNLRMRSYLQSITKYNFKQNEEFHFTSHDGHFARASKPFICMHPRAREQQTTCTVYLYVHTRPLGRVHASASVHIIWCRIMLATSDQNTEKKRDGLISIVN